MEIMVFQCVQQTFHRFRYVLLIAITVSTLLIVLRLHMTHTSYGTEVPSYYVDHQRTTHQVGSWNSKLLVSSEKEVSLLQQRAANLSLNETKLLQQAKLWRHIGASCGSKVKSFESLTPWQKNWVLRHLIVDDTYRLLYCYVPKVGCANWKRVFNVLYGDVSAPEEIKNVDHTSMKLLASYSPSEIKYRLGSYFKFMFVRHPLDRLLSAYRNKFGEHFHDFERKYGVEIVKKYRQHPPKNPKGDDVTFPEFLDYVSNTAKEKLNEHWSRYVDLCQPCYISYEFIGYYERLDEDVNFILNALQLDKVVHYPAKQSYYTALPDEDRHKYISEVPESTLTSLEAKFRDDYRFFGYGRDPAKFPRE